MSRSCPSRGVSQALNYNMPGSYQYPTERAYSGSHREQSYRHLSTRQDAAYYEEADSYSQYGQGSRTEPARYGSHSMRIGQGPYQSQEQLQRQRSKEASKQMLNTVYGNAISMLEEFESREQQGPHRLTKSNIPIPDQTRKSNEDIQSVLETQLMCLETQRKSCPIDARDEVLDDLKKKTLHWAAVREERGCPRQNTDKYAAQIYEILDKGKTDHAFNHRPRPVISARTIRGTMPHILKGKHDQTELDRHFRDDRKKMATAPSVRRATSSYALKLGRSRIEQENPDLRYSLGHHVQDDDYFDNK